MAKQIIVDVVSNSDGSVNETATRAAFAELLTKLVAERSADFDTVKVEIDAFLLENPGLRSIKGASLIRALWERKVENGELRNKSQAEKGAMYARLEMVAEEYVKSNPDRFHVGRKSGISIRYVPGEHMMGADGKPVYDKEGNEVQAFRISDEEWAKLTAPKAKPENGAAAAAQ